LTGQRLHRLEVLATPAPACGVCRRGVIKRRARPAGLPRTTCCHTFRATGIITYLENGGTIEHAQQIANHESSRTTKLHDRTVALAESLRKRPMQERRSYHGQPLDRRLQRPGGDDLVATRQMPLGRTQGAMITPDRRTLCRTNRTRHSRQDTTGKF
jgi:hypothetical protein